MHAAKHKQEIKFLSFEGPSHEHSLLNHFAIPLLAPEKKSVWVFCYFSIFSKIYSLVTFILLQS